MRKATNKKFGLTTIADAITRFDDLPSAREAMSFACGSTLEISGKLLKLVRRDGQFKLVISPDGLDDLIIFADCQTDADNIKARKIRKGSPVQVRGKFRTFGRDAVCLSDCELLRRRGGNEFNLENTKRRI